MQVDLIQDFFQMIREISTKKQLFLYHAITYNRIRMNSLKENLSTRVSKLYISNLCRQKQVDDRIIDELYRLTTDDDEKTSWNALWALSNLTDRDSRIWLQEKHDELISRAIEEAHDGKRRLILNLLSKQEFGKECLRADFIDFCLSRMLSATETVGSKALCIRLAYKQCIHYGELTRELRQSIDIMMQKPLSPAIKSVVIHIQKKLNQLL